MIASDLTATVGGTPMVELGRLAKGLPGRVVAKLEMRPAVLSGWPPGNHLMPGIGVGFVPEVLNRSVLDEVIAVTDEEAFECAQRLAREEGILAGVSSGAALHAALAVASREATTGRMVVVLLADTGERYLATPLFARDTQATTS